MGERYLTNYCAHCDGGIEFPEHGVGTEIACPHCQETITLQAEREPEVTLSRAELFFLTRFRSGWDVEGIRNVEYWEKLLKARPATVAARLLKQGLVEKTTPKLAGMLAQISTKELKDLAKARRLSETGTKRVLAKRLAEADPEGLAKMFRGRKYLHWTDKGRNLVEGFLQGERADESRAVGECLTALRGRDIQKACLARRGPNGSADPYDLRVLEVIFSEKFPRHKRLDERQAANVRVAAAMMQLWGTKDAIPYLEDGLSPARIDWGVESRMVLSRGLERVRLEDFKAIGIGRVEVLGSDRCPACAADNRKKYKIESAPTLPHDACACEGGCPCSFAAAEA